jgi:hypothetical protein
MDSLDIVIIVCVLIGALALCFVFFILCWAFQYDRRNRDQFRTGSNANREKPENAVNGSDDHNADSVSSFNPPAGTGEQAADAKKSSYDKQSLKMVYPTEIGFGDSLYPESVMSEDINSSMNQSRLHVDPFPGGRGSGHLGDVGSVSSMDVESYGYSIEAPSMATNTINDGVSLPGDLSPSMATKSINEGVSNDGDDLFPPAKTEEDQ